MTVGGQEFLNVHAAWIDQYRIQCRFIRRDLGPGRSDVLPGLP